jgi:tRNA-specific 2-thiouridylase
MTSQIEPAPAPPAGRTKAVVLLSGGLDSTLAISLLLEQGIEVLALNFVGPFCTCTPRKSAGCHLASDVAKSLGVEIKLIPKGMDYLKVVEKPRHGRGRGLNPCIDCRIYMLRKAAEVMAEIGASFVATGEVLGQRPMSQHRGALDLIERESGLAGRLLRPLSAHLLEPTAVEEAGLVDRAKLLAIRGRSRAEQFSLAHERGVEVFGCPAGGCLLTDPNIARRLKDVFDHCADWDMRDAKMATVGRHFRLNAKLKVILGHDEDENTQLAALAGGLPIVEFVAHPGPLAVLRGEYADSDLVTVGRLMRRYAKKVAEPSVELKLDAGGIAKTWTCDAAAADAEAERWLI